MTDQNLKLIEQIIQEYYNYIDDTWLQLLGSSFNDAIIPDDAIVLLSKDLFDLLPTGTEYFNRVNCCEFAPQNTIIVTRKTNHVDNNSTRLSNSRQCGNLQIF